MKNFRDFLAEQDYSERERERESSYLNEKNYSRQYLIQKLQDKLYDCNDATFEKVLKIAGIQSHLKGDLQDIGNINANEFVDIIKIKKELSKIFIDGDYTKIVEIFEKFSRDDDYMIYGSIHKDGYIIVISSPYDAKRPIKGIAKVVVS